MKRAFSLMELVFVIVVVGILAAAVIPRVERDTLYEAAEQLVSHIRHTQNLALNDNLYRDDNATWFKAMWRMSFRNCTGGGKYYIVFSDKDQGGNADYDERARDPLTHRQLYVNNDCDQESYTYNGVILSEKYGIEEIVLGGGCFGSNQYVAFDHLGRPHYDLVAPHHVVTSECTIRLIGAGGEALIKIQPETGYTRIASIIDY